MLRQSAEDLGGIQHVVLLDKLVNVEGKQGKVQQEREPVPIDQEQERNEAMQCRLRHEPRVQFVAQLDGIDVVTLQVGVHDGEEHLRKQVHRIDEHGKDK